MDFISNTEAQNLEMLQCIGVRSIEELFSTIPPHLLLSKPESDDGLAECEGIRHMQKLGAKNSFGRLDSYLGGGAYEHYIPALVPAVCSKSEFLTSYTPYQAEASQGMLQAIFEFQSAVCALTGMDMANASLYDGASACGEALLMALRANRGRQRILVAQSLNPHYRAVVNQYLASHPIELLTIPLKEDGGLDHQFIRDHLNDSTAAILVQSPSFLGIVENTSFYSEAKAAKAIVIQCADLLSYGIYASAGECGADIAVGDCQSFGLALNYGGPYVGYIACRQELMRQMPGRIVGETVDEQGQRGFVLTLQAREQHIRREKATSNICTNQALAALAVLVAILWYGKEGIAKLALTNFKRAAYLRDKLAHIEGVVLFSARPFFNEFAVKFPQPVKDVQAFFREHGIEPGLDLAPYYPGLSGYMLIAVTETKNQGQLDYYYTTAQKFMRERHE